LAYNVPHLVLTHFSEAVSEVLFPVYCRVQDDHERFRRGYVKTITFVSLITFPLMAGLTVVAEEFVRAAYGPGWLPTILPMQILCFSAAAKAVLDTLGAVFNAKGRPDIGLTWHVIMLPITVVTLLVASRWGIVGIASAMSALTLCSIVPLRLTIRLIQLPLREYLHALLPAASSSIVMMVGVLAVKHATAVTLAGLPSVAALALLVGVGALVYLGVIMCCWRPIAAEFFSLGLSMLGARRRT
jgi:O-antigen/teichoic acid export membrane protein